MPLIHTTIPVLLGPGRVDSLIATTYSLDEGELWSLAYHLSPTHPAPIAMRFEPAAFRGWDGRLVPRQWLKPFHPPPGAAFISARVPPVYHPKLLLASAGHRTRFIVSTANLATQDQRDSANLHIGFDLLPPLAKKVREWMLGAIPPRTFLLVVKRSGKPELITGDAPTWSYFNRERLAAKASTERWLLASPTWSTSALRRIAPSANSRVTAYFRDHSQAKLVAGPVAGPHLDCRVPESSLPFHHKVLAWKGRRGGKETVLLYVGSANMTSAGFFGLGSAHKLRAWNWEAGVLYVGDRDLWSIAEQAVTGGIAAWRTVPIKSRVGDKDEVTSKGEADEAAEGALRVHLRSAIRLHGRKVRRQPVRDMPQASLLRVTLDLDGKLRPLAVCKEVKVAIPAPSSARVIGVYRFEQGTRQGTLRDIAIVIPSLMAEPAVTDSARRDLEVLRRLLRVADGQPGGHTSLSGKRERLVDDSPNVAIEEDVRFPFRDLLSLANRDCIAARNWLDHVNRPTGGARGFWRSLAQRLRKEV